MDVLAHGVPATPPILIDFGWSIDWSAARTDFPSDGSIIWQDPSGTIFAERQQSGGVGPFLLRLWDIATAGVIVTDRLIVVRADRPGTTTDTLHHFVLDQVVPRVIAHVGAMVLHAGLVSAHGAGIAISGPSGRGKSTIAAGLRNFGYVLHGDDGVVIRKRMGQFLGSSVYPSLRVLPDTLARLIPAGPDVRAVASYSNKVRIPVPLHQSEMPSPVPLTRILFLAPPLSDDRITLRPMRPAEACMALIENSFALDPTDRERARTKLQVAAALADSVPAFELSYPREYGRLGDVRRVLIEAGILPSLEGDPVSPGLRA